jgi:hypothetical protein
LELLDLDDDLALAELMERLDEGKASIDRAVMYWQEMIGDPQRPTPEPWNSWIPPTVKYKYSSFLRKYMIRNKIVHRAVNPLNPDNSSYTPIDAHCHHPLASVSATFGIKLSI